ncbi:glycosyltransferase family 4 protein [Haloferula sp. A504]|uniref:glycosyltransferase family 4 protein n=1 Tax=Haloferula sp. A504 TaxID=3373601 RepID=UPI0031C54E72|nr:glycosyltransferase family 4 protein [Verrucomicrobiaceae bacterium E54]
MGLPKVLMLGWEYPPKITGGLGVACAALAGALRDKVDLTVRLPDGDTGDAYGGGRDYEGDLLRQVQAFAGTGHDGDFDLIHAHDWLTVPAAMELARKRGLPIVLHLHSLELDRSEQRNRIFLIERAGMRAAERVIAVSRYTAARCERYYRIPAHKIAVVPNGVGTPPRPGTAGRRCKVLFVGRMTPQKAPQDFVRMAALVAGGLPQAEFAMVGSGELLEEVKRLAADEGIADRIRFPGFLSRSAVMAELADASVLCLPSKSEPFGLVALEAAAHGVPAVVTDHCGVAEVLSSARVVPVGDVAAMAGAVSALLRAPGLRDSLGNQARDETGRASWQRAAERVLAVYHEVLATR